MPGLGTLINCAGALAGGILGLLLKKGLSERFQSLLMQAVGLATLFIGVSGALEGMFSVQGNALETNGTMMAIVCLALGALLGEWADLDGRMSRLGVWLREKSGSSGDTRFVTGFVSTSLTICVGAMAIVGAIHDGIEGDISILCAKTVLDTIIVFVMASSLGKGCLFSVLPLAALQGGVTVLSRLIQPLLTQAALTNLSVVGSMLIFCVGINLMFQKNIKVANLLPALVVAVAYAFLPFG